MLLTRYISLPIELPVRLLLWILNFDCYKLLRVQLNGKISAALAFIKRNIKLILSEIFVFDISKSLFLR